MGSRCMTWCRYDLRMNNPIPPYLSKLKVQLPAAPQARSQSFPDEENSSNTVDAKMNALRCRIEQVRMRERLNTCYKLEGGHGWNYRSGYDDVLKKHNMLITSFQLLTIVVNSIALVFLTGSICIFLLSFFFSPSKN